MVAGSLIAHFLVMNMDFRDLIASFPTRNWEPRQVETGATLRLASLVPMEDLYEISTTQIMGDLEITQTHTNISGFRMRQVELPSADQRSHWND